MSRFRLVAAGILVVGTAGAGGFAGDTQNVAVVLSREACLQCHSLSGVGGKTARDLGRSTAREYTPSLMASLMWNHAPEMWAAAVSSGASRPSLTEQEAGSLFAYFYETRYFDRMGDANRGKQTFARLRCEGCHPVAGRPAVGAPPVTEWTSLFDPLGLVQAMWNHPAVFRRAAREPITSQEMTDMLLYLRHLPGTRDRTPVFTVTLVSNGGSWQARRGCPACHNGERSLDRKMKGATLLDVAVAMWNHPLVNRRLIPAVDRQDVGSLASGIWAAEFFRQAGNAQHGRRFFEKKGCGSCHNGASKGVKDLGAKSGYSAITMVAALWSHGPAMQREMKAKGLAWPHFEAGEMEDLVAYLNSVARPKNNTLQVANDR